MESATTTNDQQNIDGQPKKSKAPKELEETQQEALVLCWKQSSEDTFLCEWNPTTKQFNRRFQANNKHLDEAMDINLGDWYQICFVKYKKSDVHISILECEEVLEAPFGTRIRDLIIQLFPNVSAVNSILKKMTKEGKHSDFPFNFDKLNMDPNQFGQLTPPASGLDKPISKDFGFEDEVAVPEDLQLEVIKRTQLGQCRLELGEQGTNGVRVYGPDLLSVKECVKRMKEARNQLMLQERKEKENCSPPVQEVKLDSRPTSAAFGDTVQQRSFSRSESFKSRQEVQAVHHVPRPLSSVQPFALSAPDSKRKLSVASFRASTPARKCPTQKAASNTYRQVLDVPKKYRGVLVGHGGNTLAKLQSRYGIKLTVPREYSDNPVEITGTDGNSVNECKQAIEAMIRRLQMQTKRVNVPMRNWRAIPFLIGTNGNNINQLRAQFPHVKLEIPRQSDLEAIGDECVPVITLQGDPDEVDSLRELLVQKIKELEENHFILCIPFPTDHPDQDVSSFANANAKMLREIQEEYPNCIIYPDLDRRRFHLEGKKRDVEAVKRRIQEILDKMNEITRKVSIPAIEQRFLSPHFGEMRDKFSVKCHFQNNQLVMVGSNESQLDATEHALLALRPFIMRLEFPKECHQQLMAMVGEKEKLHNLEQKFNVHIDVQKPQEGQHTMQLSVVGTEEMMIERCVSFIQADMPINRLVKVAQEFRDHFLGNGGKLVQQLRQKHEVQIHFAPALDCPDDVAVMGNALKVGNCVREILRKVTQIQAEKNSASLASTYNVRTAASTEGSNGIQRTASAATGFQTFRGNSSQ